MIRQYYFPKTLNARPGWLQNFATQLPHANDTLQLPAEEVAAAVNEALFLAYVFGVWLRHAREFGTACTAAAEALSEEYGVEPFALPVFTPPPLPDGVGPVPAGALQRLFAMVRRIKTTRGYVPSIGLQLGIVGEEDAADHPLPTFTLAVERGEAGELVRVTFRRFGWPGVAIQGRRGGGAWDPLAIVLKSPWSDRRPLLVPSQPEVREYRLRYYEGSGPTGEFIPVARITVAP